MSRIPITKDGELAIKEELSQLKFVERPKISEAIAEARAHGDLKENAEYHAAKEQQALIESRIIVINDLIARANVIDVAKIDNDGIRVRKANDSDGIRVRTATDADGIRVTAAISNDNNNKTIYSNNNNYATSETVSMEPPDESKEEINSFFASP